MSSDLNTKLAEAKQRIQAREQLERDYAEARENLAATRKQLQATALHLEQAAIEVRTLEGVTLDRFLYALQGSRTQRLEAARQACTELENEYNQYAKTLSRCERDAERLERRIAQDGDPQEQYASLLKRKQEQLDDETGQPEQLRELGDARASVRAAVADIQRAVDAGNEAFDDLQNEIGVVGTLGRCQVSEGAAPIRWAMHASRRTTSNQSATRVAQSVRRFCQRLGDVLSRHGADEANHLPAFAESLERIADKFTGESLSVSPEGVGPAEELAEQLGTATALLEKKLDLVKQQLIAIEEQHRAFIETA
jgi:hypothetical protein